MYQAITYLSEGKESGGTDPGTLAQIDAAFAEKNPRKRKRMLARIQRGLKKKEG